MLADTLGFGIVLPGAIAAVLYVLTHKVYRRPEKKPVWTGAAAVGLGFAAGQFGLSGFQGLLPIEASGWLSHLAMLSIVVSFFYTQLKSRTRTHLVLRLVLSFAVPFLILQSMWKHSWEPLWAAIWIASIGSAVFLFGVLQTRSHRIIPKPSISLMQVILALGISLTLAGSGSMKLGQLGGMLTAALGVKLLLDMFRPNLTSNSTGETAICNILLPSLGLLGWFYSELPTASLVLLALTPALLLLANPGIQKISKKPWQTLIRAATSLTPTTAAVLIAVLSAPDAYPY